MKSLKQAKLVHGRGNKATLTGLAGGDLQAGTCEGFCNK